MASPILGGVPGEHYSVQVMGRKAGLNDAESIMMGVGAWWSPMESSPDSAVTHVIVKGVQNLLRRRGVAIKPTGFYGTNTHEALVRVLGPQYVNRAWVQIYGDLLEGTGWSTPPDYSAPTATGGFVAQKGFADTLAQLVGAGAGVVTGLQTQTNRFSNKVGFAPISTDGVVGPDTVSKATTVAKWIIRTYLDTSMLLGALANQDLSSPDSVSYLNSNASALSAAFKSYADRAALPIAGGSPSSGGAPVYTAPIGSGSSISDLAVPALVGAGVLWLLFGSKKKGRK